MKKIIISQEQANDFCFGMGSAGVCLACGMVDQYAGCEPDAREYECPECGEHKLYGFEEAIMMDVVEITK